MFLHCSKTTIAVNELPRAKPSKCSYIFAPHFSPDPIESQVPTSVNWRKRITFSETNLSNVYKNDVSKKLNPCDTKCLFGSPQKPLISGFWLLEKRLCAKWLLLLKNGFWKALSIWSANLPVGKSSYRGAYQLLILAFIHELTITPLGFVKNCTFPLIIHVISDEISEFLGVHKKQPTEQEKTGEKNCTKDF